MENLNSLIDVENNQMRILRAQIAQHRMIEKIFHVLKSLSCEELAAVDTPPSVQLIDNFPAVLATGDAQHLQEALFTVDAKAFEAATLETFFAILPTLNGWLERDKDFAQVAFCLLNDGVKKFSNNSHLSTSQRKMLRCIAATLDTSDSGVASFKSSDCSNLSLHIRLWVRESQNVESL